MKPRKRIYASLFSILLIIALLVTSIPVFADSPAPDRAGPQIMLQYSSFDPLAGEPNVPQSLSISPSAGSDLYIVQFNGPVEEAWQAELEAAGAKILDYIPNFAYIVRMSGNARPQVNAISSVRWVGVFQPAYKVHSDLQGKEGELDVVIQLFDDASPDSVAKSVKNLGGKVLSADGLVVRAAIPAPALPRIAADSQVSWIEPFSEKVLHNDKSQAIVDVDAAWTDHGLYGKGQVVAISDTGLDTGNASTISQDIRGRLIAAYARARSSWSDPHGHGTHVAGSVLGNGKNSGSNPAAHSYAGSMAGFAPEARLVFQSVMDSAGYLSGIPQDLNVLFQQSYNAGARIQTNSWGAHWYGAYSVDSKNTDKFMWDHPDFTILFSAGNDGEDANSSGIIDADSIGSPGTAKNCITVGAAEGNRPPSSGWGGYANNTWGWFDYISYPVIPISSDFISNNINGMAAFSSRGPTDDNRIKPDIVAPGTSIVSIKSTVPGAGVGWGAYTQNNKYVYMGGTSMSTPLTAGATALVREYLVKKTPNTSPSAALVKATLLNGAVDMAPGQYGTGSYTEVMAAPNVVEGWGRVNMDTTLNSAPQLIDNKTGLGTGQSVSKGITVDGTTPLNITLAWTDYPGSTAVIYQLVNDLDLKLIDPNGAVIWGNGVTNGDGRNNVEGIRIANPTAGTYRMEVKAYNVPKGKNGKQPYAVVVSGGQLMKGWQGELLINGGTAETTSKTVSVEFAATPPTGYPVAAYRLGQPVNGLMTWGPWVNADSLPIATDYDLWTGPDGTKKVSVKFKDQGGTVSPEFSDSIVLNTAPGLVGPADNEQFTSPPTLSWEAVAGATKYKVTVQNVSSGVIKTYVVTGATFLAVPQTDVKIGKSYQWKVKAFVYDRWSGPSEKRIFKMI